MERRKLLGAAFGATIPVLLGYSTIGIAYGLLFVTAGLPWWLAPVSSVVVYAGAAQFMAINLLAGGTGLLEIALLTLLINARHMVYGLSLLGPFGEAKRWRPYLVYALTDETYGLLTTQRPPKGASRESYFALVSALDQSYWVAGTLVGALAGALIPAAWTEGLDFALTALFIVLLVEQARGLRSPLPYLVALASSFIALALVGAGNLLVVAILIAIGGILVLRPLLEKTGGKAASGPGERSEP